MCWWRSARAARTFVSDRNNPRSAGQGRQRILSLFNNPVETLCGNIERSRIVIEDPRVVCLPLVSGPMAVAGSTRMQATTFEMLVAGAALEEALAAFLHAPVPGAQIAIRLVASLRAGGCITVQSYLDGLAALTEYEERLYRAKGRVTYYAGEYLLDIFTGRLNGRRPLCFRPSANAMMRLRLFRGRL